nr:reverse transcriptase domain-containing protein [Tanacetum cinerariifolium]
MATDENGDPPVPDLRTMEELCQPTLNGQCGPIATIAIQETNFGLKNDMIQQVQNSCQFHGLPSDDANKHLDKFLHVTQSIKVNGVTDDALRLNEITNFRQRPDESLFEAWERYKLSIDHCPNHNMLPVTQIAMEAEMAEINKNLMKVLQINQQVKAVAHNYETCSGPHSYNDCPATVGQTQNTNMTSLTNSNLELKNMFGQFMKMNTASSSGSRTLPSNTITNPKEDLKGITTRSGNAYKGPTTPTTTSSPPKVVERETEVRKDTVPPTNNGSTKDVQPPVVQTETPIPNSEPVVVLVAELVVSPVSASKPNSKTSIPYTSRLHDQKLRDKANDQKEKFFKIFQDLDFNISFVDVLILMPKFGPTLKTCKEYSQEVLGFFMNGNPTPYTEPIVSNSSPSLTPFGESDFLLEETDAFLAIDDVPISSKINESYYDSEGEILLLEEFLNDDPSSPPIPP